MPSLVYYIDVGVKSPNYDARIIFLRQCHCYFFLGELLICKRKLT